MDAHDFLDYLVGLAEVYGFKGKDAGGRYRQKSMQVNLKLEPQEYEPGFIIKGTVQIDVDLEKIEVRDHEWVQKQRSLDARVPTD
jgi:hypothetical protein